MIDYGLSTRESFGRALVRLADEYPKMVVLDADLAKATQTLLFKQAHPDRFIECGIAESNMIGVAAGLAASGKLPVAASFAMFSAGRAFEQIRNSVAYPRLNVKIVGSHGGITVGEDGASHQALEDIALMRTLPGMTVLCPCDEHETTLAVEGMLACRGPFYLRTGRLAAPNVTNSAPGYHFEIGKGAVLRPGEDVALIACGAEVSQALLAAQALSDAGVSAMVIDMHTVKPLDEALTLAAARRCGCVVTSEEHSVHGGLGDAVSQALMENCPVPAERVGTKDVFGCSGEGYQLLAEFGLDARAIKEAALRVLERKARA